ncbi:MAG: response regulator [Pirellulales bacterium]|nr:response regulator [Pirellulales bacterium]
MRQDTVGRPMEILLVEDNLEDARMTMEALKQGQVQCRVSLVRDGDEAFRFLHRRDIYARAPRPDLVLLDLKLPKRSGRQVLEEIRASEDLSSIPVVVLTASEIHEEILREEGLEVESYMVKPVDIEQFIRVVRHLRRYWMAEIILPAFD